jgi:hypothetical protein
MFGLFPLQRRKATMLMFVGTLDYVPLMGRMGRNFPKTAASSK